MNDAQLAHSEMRASRVRQLGEHYQALVQKIVGILSTRNGLKPKRESEEALGARIQAIITTSDLSALVDILERMGKIDRADYTAQCVERLRHALSQIESPN